jgi:hypothetical protein
LKNRDILDNDSDFRSLELASDRIHRFEYYLVVVEQVQLVDFSTWLFYLMAVEEMDDHAVLDV